MSPEALRKTGYFDPETVGRDYALIAAGQASKVGVFKRLGLSGVVATQLWHHLYISGGLCELPDLSPRPQVERPRSRPPQLDVAEAPRLPHCLAPLRLHTPSARRRSALSLMKPAASF